MGKQKNRDMNRFIDELMSRMSLKDKLGQLNNPNSVSDDTTGAARGVDATDRVRRGEVGTISGDNLARRRALQKIAVEESPHGIPLAFAVDVNHGYRTVFPVSLGLACSWDMKLIGEMAAIQAAEGTTDGISITWTPMVDLARDARWGRVAEGAGEDPYLGARIAAAMVKGLQGGDLSRPDTMMATAKHFAGYGMAEGGQDYNTVDISAYKMHNVILPPFKAAVEAGVGAIMVAFNDLSGIPATAHKKLLQNLLRDRWGFDGLLVTDYTAVEELQNHGTAADLKDAALKALKAGITNDLVSDAFIRHGEALVREGKIGEQVIDRACRRVLEAKYRLGLFDDPYRYFHREGENILSPAHRAKAREAAAKSCVLLKNDNGVLPLKKDNLKIALVGPLAAGEEARANMQGTWAVSAKPQDSITVLEGIKNVAGDKVEIRYARGCNIVEDQNIAARLDVHNRSNPTAKIDPRPLSEMIAEAVAAAERSDVVIACLGEAKEHSGESSTRTDLGLPGAQQELLKALKQTGKPVVLISMSGRPLALEWENDNVDAILHAWFGGTEAGNGIADLLFGERNPSGKLAMSFPRTAGQCPIYYNHPPTGRPREKVGIDVYGDTEKAGDGLNVFRKFTTACRLEGPNTPLFPFGYGLSYTGFAYGPVRVNKADLVGENDVLEASVTVKNTGKLPGEETVQLYITDPAASRVRPVRELKGFEKIMLQPGEEREVTFIITPDDLKFFKADELDKPRHIWEAGEFIIQIGASSQHLQAASVNWRKGRKPAQQPKPGG